MSPSGTHRRVGRRRAAITFGGFVFLLGTMALFAGAQIALLKNNPDGARIAVTGLCLMVPGYLLMRWARSTAAQAEWDDAAEASRAAGYALPYGAYAKGEGVWVRRTAAARLLAPWLAAMMFFLAWLFFVSEVPAGAILLMLALGALMAWIALLGRRQEVSMNSEGLWRHHRPRARIAWRDLRAVDQVMPNPTWNKNDIEHLFLRGHVETPRGRTRDHIELRMKMLEVSTPQLMRMMQHYSEQPITEADHEMFDRFA